MKMQIIIVFLRTKLSLAQRENANYLFALFLLEFIISMKDENDFSFTYVLKARRAYLSVNWETRCETV